GIETGIQNSTIAIAIALSVFDSEDLAIVPGLYGLWMLITGFAFAFWLRARTADAAAVDATLDPSR
ncbi:MAG: bile acid:sodium symporter family protein, partial [Actinomycetota bacterium]